MSVVLPVDIESLRVCPKVYAQHSQVTVGEDAVLMFSHKAQASLSEDGSNPQLVAFPQCQVFMTLPHFLNFVEVLVRQADAIRSSHKELVAAMEEIKNRVSED